jgi:hypothetical protein
MSMFRSYQTLQKTMCNQRCTYKYPYMTICGLISYITLTSMFEQEQRRKDMDILKKELNAIKKH